MVGLAVQEIGLQPAKGKNIFVPGLMTGMVEPQMFLVWIEMRIML
jgi:hypothetical protein